MKGRRPSGQDHDILDSMMADFSVGKDVSDRNWAGSDGRFFDPQWQAQSLDEEKITDVKEKLYDHEYLDDAISSIALLVSSRLLRGSDNGRRTTQR